MPMDTIKVAVAGAAGRMGRTLTRVAHETPGIVIAGGLEAPQSPQLGADLGILAGIGPIGVAVTGDAPALLAGIDAIVDFTTPAASLALAELAAQARIVHVLGTTGLKPEHDAAIAAAARHARIVRSGNMSVGVNLLAALVRRVAQTLGDEFDIEILEMHHRHKVDAPSGTALLLGDAAAAGRTVELGACAIRSRDGHTGARPPGAIGFATLRGGSVIGEHSVVFAGPAERIELTHRAESRDIFARGALRAALWAYPRKPGLYTMMDVLDLGPGSGGG
jgi:4-hydroxy-tetrahydrodipicolinate reductase